MTTYALNGLGRMGKLALKPLLDSGAEIAWINDAVGSPEMHAHLLEFDSVHGRWDAAFSHDLLKIPIRDTVADIEKHSVKDHALREMVPFEINRHGWAIAFKLKNPHLPCSSRPNQPRKLCDRTRIA